MWVEFMESVYFLKLDQIILRVLISQKIELQCMLICKTVVVFMDSIYLWWTVSIGVIMFDRDE